MDKLVLIAIVGLLFSCAGTNSDENSNQPNENETVINSPLNGDFQNDTIFKLDPKVANTFHSPNGTSIEIPANAIVDANGNPIEEQVDLAFTQYHSAADILASGIPMTYDSAGVSNNFESAGMFTLDARVNNEKVYVKEGESLKVNLASDKDQGFNFYELNEQTGDWTFENAPEKPAINPRHDPSRKPILPKEASEDAFVLDLNFDLSDYEELSIFSGIVWEYVGDQDSLDPRKNKWVTNTQFNDFDLSPTNEVAYEYFLTMKKGEKSFTTKVKAALQGEDFENALAAYQSKKIEIADKIDYLQKPFIRSVNISGFGTYNYDFIHSMADPEPILADFNFHEMNKYKEKSLVFVVYPNSDIVVNYPKAMWPNFGIDKSLDAKILAILPDNQVAVYNQDISSCYGKNNYTFDMDVLDEKLDNKGDLEKIIARL
ncbi:MAG: hypothetical protein ABJG68_04685 [Crocinitomicaceae bacterium]